MSELSKRILAGAVMIAVALGALWMGGIVFGLLASACGLLMMREWAGLLRADRVATLTTLFLLGLFLVQSVLLANGAEEAFGQAMIGIVPSSLWPFGGKLGIIGFLAGLTALGAFIVRRVELAMGMIYAGLPILALLIIRIQPAGLPLTLWTLAVVWATDIGAYFAGRAIGGPKLAPSISPSKTWSGLCGGMLAAGLTGAEIAWRAQLPPLLLWLGVVMAILAQAGDLFESWLKRRAGVKDSGGLIPGHGGVLDRLDGLVPVATVMGGLIWGGAL